MSKRLILAFVWIISGMIACNSPSTPFKPKDFSKDTSGQMISHIDFASAKIDIQAVMDQQSTDWNRGDIDAFMTGYWHSDSLKFITKNGIRMGYDSVALNYKKSYDSQDKMGRLNFTDLLISPLDQHHTTAHVTGKWEVVQKDKTLSGIFSLIFRQVNGEWKIIIDHTW